MTKKKRFNLIFVVIAIIFSLAFIGACGGEPSENESSAEQEQTEEESEQTEEEEQNESGETQTEVTIMYVTIGGNKLQVDLEDNTSAKALVEILRQGDITYAADDYGGFEKVGDIGYTLPQNNKSITTQAGDVILYQGNNICLYYGTNTWSFTKIGHISGFTQEQLRALLCAGDGSVEVTLSLN